MESIRTVGEFGLIDRLRAALGEPTDGRLLLGIGDDAAVWRAGDGYAIATTDTMVAGVHFLPGVADWRSVGWKALAVNVSDIAAMGGTPSFALVTLCVPPEPEVGALDELYAGLRECADEYGVTVAGGDIVSAPALVITVALYGDAALAADGGPALLRRDGAQVGDVVAVTGALGSSAAGLRLLQQPPSLVASATDAVRPLVEAHRRPRPRLDAGRAAVEAGVRCAIDVSDGLVRDLGHICTASGLDADLWLGRLPIADAVRSIFASEAEVLAATGGEDYELILVAADDVLRAAEQRLGATLHDIGRMREGDGIVHILDARGAEVELPSPGWDHLARA